MKIFLAFLAISLVILESQAGVNRRWIQNPGFGGPPQEESAEAEDALDADLDLDVAELVRRSAAQEESQLSQQSQGQEEDAEFGNEGQDTFKESNDFEQSQQDNEVDFSQQESGGSQIGDKYEQESGGGGGIDEGLVGQEQVPSQESGQYIGQQSGYEQGPVQQLPSGGEFNQQENDLEVDQGTGKGQSGDEVVEVPQEQHNPWYKKVGRFFKNTFGRKRRDDYNF